MVNSTTRGKLQSLLLWIISAASVADACIVTAPNVVRLGVEETLVVFNRGVATKDVSLLVQDYPGRLNTLFRHTVSLGPEESQVIRMRLDTEKINAKDVTMGQPRYVSLIAECGNTYKKEARLLISDKGGYLLLQTDKPIYTPKQTVNIRVVAVGENLVPTTGQVKLKIKNPQDIVTYKTVLDTTSNSSGTGMFSHSYRFPESPILGEWKAVVTHGAHLTQETEVKFTLDEYVLPTFSVELTLPSVILTDQEYIDGEVLAKYVYGKPVVGSVAFRFRLRNEANQDTEVGSTNFKELIDGKGRFRIATQEFRMMRSKRWGALVKGNRFVVEADVLDKATSKRESTIDDSAIFASSPYLVTFSSTPKDFKPGTSTMIVAEIKHVNGKPAIGIPTELTALDDREEVVLVDTTSSTSDNTGRVAFSVQTSRFQTALKIKVQTKDPKYASHQQADGNIVLHPFTSPTNAFVSLKRIDTRVALKVGEHFDGYARAEPSNISPIYYMVISRGQTKAHGKVNESSFYKTFGFQVTPEMSPGARVLVYAFHEGHLLADSMNIEVEEVCTGSSDIEIEPEFRSEEPGSSGVLNVRGREGTRVGILAVDKAVYILNNKELLTREKLFTVLKSHDLGCGPGGGLTSDVVLADTGIVIISEETLENAIRTDNSCESRIRRRRSILKRAADNFQDPFLRQCCILGQKRDRLGRTCQARADIVYEHMDGKDQAKECSEAFEECCKEIRPQGFPGPRVPNLQATGDERARHGIEFITEDSVDEVDGPSTSPLVRRDFRETWLFDEGTVGSDGTAKFSASLPHSITTWSVQAVSVSPTGGVCVPPSKEVRAFQDIFLQVSIPYKVVRNEQIEVLATVYNYGSRSLLGNVYIYGAEGLCTGAPVGQRSERRPIQVNATSAASVTFPVIPLKEGEFVVKIHVKSTRGEDIVEKVLNVVPEGVTVEKSISIPIDPTNERRRKTRSIRGDRYQDSLDTAAKVQVIAVNTRLPPDAVPDTKHCSLSVIGNKIGPSVQTTLQNIENMIAMPTGCGEQNMMLMAPTLYTLEYLKHKGVLNATLEEKAYRYVREGYEQELSFRKPDGAFSAFKHRDSSVWLTAFVMRVFCKARQYASIDPEVIKSGMLWLASRQEIDGSFKERKPIMHKVMLGGVKGSVPMTAFVLLTFYECQSPSDTEDKIIGKTKSNAEEYLNRHVHDIHEPYVAALVAYALSLGNNPEKHTAMDVMKDELLYDHMLNTRSTGEEATPLVVEGTSYALLAFLEHNDLESSSSIVNWLNTHRSASGSFVSTQDTVVALQALTEFALKARESYLDLMCNVTLSNQRNFKKSIRLKRENAAILQQLDIPDVSGKMFVSASGTGSGLLSVKIKYNVLVPPEALCKFNITVKAEVHIERKKSVKSLDFPPDLLDELLGPEPNRKRRSPWFFGARESRMSSLAGSFNGDPRDRGSIDPTPDTSVNLDRTPQKSKLLYDIEVCSRYLGGSESNMAVIEVGIFSGFVPVEKDLKEETARNELLAKYEITEKNVILYFDKIPAEVPTCVKFRAEREHVVHNVQSAVVKVYDYYNPMHSCTQFYGPGSTSPLLKLICEDNQCQCAEAECPSKEPFHEITKAGSIFRQRKNLGIMACENHDFAWKGQVFSNEVENGYRNIRFKVDVAVKEGAENKTALLSNLKILRARELCHMADLTVGGIYMIFGEDSEPFERNGNVIRRYDLNQNVRIFNMHDRSSTEDYRKLSSLFQWLTTGFIKRGGCGPQ
ncbi:complement C3 [Ixodes scapularis]|uniref:complement C3 n=1 Tax=Ixodes scapularis TaxID=6945 RepID=UPI001A9FF41A|nr:complement C3 [Ixodes scapularis]